jgi:hypothetical protein
MGEARLGRWARGEPTPEPPGDGVIRPEPITDPDEALDAWQETRRVKPRRDLSTHLGIVAP